MWLLDRLHQDKKISQIERAYIRERRQLINSINLAVAIPCEGANTKKGPASELWPPYLYSAGARRLSLEEDCGSHWKKKLSHFDLNSWVTGGTKIWPGIPSNWRMFELNWLDIERQFEIRYSNIRVNLTQIFSNYSESWVEF